MVNDREDRFVRDGSPDERPLPLGDRLESIGGYRKGIGPPDRQILVSGRGDAGLLLAAYLDRAGYEPVLVGDRPVGSGVEPLWHPGLLLLDRLGAGDAVRTGARAVNGMDLRPPGPRDGNTSGSAATDFDAGPPFVVDPIHVTECLESFVPDRLVRPDWRIEAVESRRDGLEVEFDNGVREWFDIVVDAGDPSSILTERDDVDFPRLARFDCALHFPGDRPAEYETVVTTSSVAQTVPRVDVDGTILRISSTSTPRTDPMSLAAWRETAPGLFDGEFDRLLRGASIDDVRHESVPQAESSKGRWSEGAIAYCGPAAYPVAPGGSLGPALAFEDAWVLATELVHGPESATAAVQNYARRRKRRIRAVLRRGDRFAREAEVPVCEQSEPLSTLTRIGGACASVVGRDHSSAILTEIPDRL